MRRIVIIILFVHITALSYAQSTTGAVQSVQQKSLETINGNPLDSPSQKPTGTSLLNDSKEEIVSQTGADDKTKSEPATDQNPSGNESSSSENKSPDAKELYDEAKSILSSLDLPKKHKQTEQELYKIIEQLYSLAQEEKVTAEQRDALQAYNNIRQLFSNDVAVFDKILTFEQKEKELLMSVAHGRYTLIENISELKKTLDDVDKEIDGLNKKYGNKEMIKLAIEGRMDNELSDLFYKIAQLDLSSLSEKQRNYYNELSDRYNKLINEYFYR